MEDKDIVALYWQRNQNAINESRKKYGNYLEETYNRLNKIRIILCLFGADRFNISIGENRVNVHLTSDNQYIAIYIANKTDTLGGAIIFNTHINSSDSNS